MPEGFSFIIQNESSLRCAYSVAFPRIQKMLLDLLSVSSVAVGVFAFVSKLNFTGEKCASRSKVSVSHFHQSMFFFFSRQVTFHRGGSSFCAEYKTVNLASRSRTVLVYLCNFGAGRNRVQRGPRTVRGSWSPPPSVALSICHLTRLHRSHRHKHALRHACSHILTHVQTRPYQPEHQQLCAKVKSSKPTIYSVIRCCAQHRYF